jgi:hypothetical protein
MKAARSSSAKVVGVLLTKEGWADLADVLEPYTLTGRIGKFIYCRHVEPNGYYFVIVGASRNDGGDVFEAEIGIPHRYVRSFILAADRTQLGFT